MASPPPPQITELNQLTEGAGMSRAGGAGEEKDLLCLAAMSHLAGPLSVALSTPDAELLVHQAGEMHVPEEVQSRRVA